MKRSAYAAAAVVLLLAALVVIAPALIDTPAVRAEIQRRVSQALHGQVTWEALRVALLPAPRGELKKVRVEIPGRVDAAADEVHVYLRLWPLLRGEPEISSLSVVRPRVRIARAEGDGPEARIDAVAAYRAAIEPTVRALRDLAPQMTLKLTDAAVDVDLPAKPLELRQLNAALDTKSGGLELALSAASNFWQRLELSARVEYTRLSMVGDLALDGLVLDKDLPAMSVRAKPRSDGESAIECEFDAMLGTLAAAKGKLLLPAGKPPQLSADVTGVDLPQALDLARRKGASLEVIESAAGRVSLAGSATLQAAWQAELRITKSDAAVKIAPLPAAISIAGGAVRADARHVRIDQVGVAMLDARALVSGTFDLKNSAADFAVADGVTGEKLVRWAMELAQAPARLEPKTPLRFSARRIAWAPQGALEADARFEFDAGPVVGVALAWRPERLELRRVAIKDARSDAVFGASVAGNLIRASFSGRLHGQSIPAVLREPPAAVSGTAQGKLDLSIDRKQPGRTTAAGTLRIEALDLSWLTGSKALIERADIAADETGMRVSGARFAWEEQIFELSGRGRRTNAGPVVEARIESPGVDALRLLPPPDPNAPKKERSTLWPLPVSGRIELASGFVQYRDHRIEPFAGVVTLEPRRARLEVTQARMCGVSFPFELDAQPGQNSAALHVRMKDQPLERTVPCLTGGGVQLTGNADLTAELRTQGARPHLLRDMTGTLQAEMRQGRVMKFALLGNILSFRGISSFGEMKEDGFAYRSMIARGRFEHGRFLVEESFFDSDAVRLAAHGTVDMLGADSQLTVLVGLLTRVDRVAGAVPIIGDIFGGSMTALPISVRGDIRDPVIVPLGPRAVSEQLLGIFERTLKLPGKLVVPPQGQKP